MIRDYKVNNNNSLLTFRVTRCHSAPLQSARDERYPVLVTRHGDPPLKFSWPTMALPSESDLPTSTIAENSAPPKPLSVRALIASEPYDPCVLLEVEHYWRDRSLWLKERGYTLRPRYSPDWKPSWVGSNKRRIDCEDSRLAPGVCIMILSTHGIHVAEKAIGRSRFGCDA